MFISIGRLRSIISESILLEKYEKWIKREVDKGHKTPDVTATRDFFIQHQNKFPIKDIFQWDAKDLENYIKDNQDKFASRRKARRGKYEKLFEDDQYLIVRPDDKQAARFWGVNTKWCITQEDANYYNDYRNSKENVIFYYIIDKINNDKLALAIYRDQENNIKLIEYYDAIDDQFDDPPENFADIVEQQYDLIKNDAEVVEPTLIYKIKHLGQELTLQDEEEILKSGDSKLILQFVKKVPGANIEKIQNLICKNPRSAYFFAKDIPGANIEKCQEIACKEPKYAYLFALDIPGADIEKCQKAACKFPQYAYQFAKDIPGADIEYCQEVICFTVDWLIPFAKDIPEANIEKCQDAACKDPYHAFAFAREIPGADIEKCQEAACKKPEYAYQFAKIIPGADIEYCQRATCKNPEWAKHFLTKIPGADPNLC